MPDKSYKVFPVPELKFHKATVFSSFSNDPGTKLSEYLYVSDIFISLIRPLKNDDSSSEFTPIKRSLNGPEKSKKSGASIATNSS